LKIPKGGNQNLYIEEEQTTQWSKEKVQKDKQRSTKHTYKTTDRVTRTPLKTGGEIRCSRRVSSSSSTSETLHVNLITNPVINHERGKDREVLTTSGTHPWSFVTQIFHSGQPSRGGDRKTFEVMTST
jgi:phage repressor protein C with HTH and peptisase S24 domain